MLSKLIEYDEFLSIKQMKLIGDYEKQKLNDRLQRTYREFCIDTYKNSFDIGYSEKELKIYINSNKKYLRYAYVNDRELREKWSYKDFCLYSYLEYCFTFNMFSKLEIQNE